MDYLKGKKILIAGASCDLSVQLNQALQQAGAVLGLHFNSNPGSLTSFKEGKKLKKFQKSLKDAGACHDLVNEFVQWAGGIDCFIQLVGDVHRSVHWLKMQEADWDHDLDVNLKVPFFLAQRAFGHMQENGGRIILMSTASASHGGGNSTRAYSAARAGVECLVKGLARDGAKDNILVNGIAPGFIMSKFHERLKRDKKELKERIAMIPLQRGGTVDEFTGTMMFLLSPAAAYMTGEVLTLSGGDWL